MEEPNFIGLCYKCGVSEGHAWQAESNPPIWEARCKECGSEDIVSLDETGIKESKHQAILEIYQELSESDKYEERQQAKGFVVALDVLI